MGLVQTQSPSEVDRKMARLGKLCCMPRTEPLLLT